ncbi:hypothetical protein O6P43_002837 [Quillaja saponaria]|uniref:Uncharacterized protein n=1 Tax=Quillaja saponaria TaxID=32244 RepID=A0AAD7QDR3_QUISA|nr:hypothetical protein O6P43_002837 [Quillaja saponaria]
MYLVLMEIGYMEFELLQYIWVRRWYFGFVFHFLKWLMEFPFWWEQHLPVSGAILSRSKVPGFPQARTSAR